MSFSLIGTGRGNLLLSFPRSDVSMNAVVLPRSAGRTCMSIVATGLALSDRVCQHLRQLHECSPLSYST